MQSKTDEAYSFLASGRALFLPLQDSLWDLRRATKQGISNQGELCLYTVTRRIDFYPRMIDLILCDKQKVLEELREHETAMSGKKGDAFRCVAFWDAQNEEGILFHRQLREILTAHLPPLTMADVIREQAILCRLNELSQSAKGVPTFLEHSIHSGRHDLSELLDILSND